MTWWSYLLLVNIYLVLFYGFYALLLRKETFFQLNRVYLVSAAVLSFFIPLIQAEWVKNMFITQQVQHTIYGSPVMAFSFKPVAETNITIGQVWVVVYVAGIVFLTGRFIWQLIALKREIVRPQSSASYSFFKKIKLGDDMAGNEVIAAHEHVHASQWHSADVLMIEAVMIVNWFNPVVYLYRFAIKHIHEFIADRQALKLGTSKTEYALLLLSQTFNTPNNELVNTFFNQSLLKQRIIMLQKNKSQRVALLKYCCSVPLFILMLILSSATINNSETIHLITKKTELILLTPANLSESAIKNNLAPAVIQKEIKKVLIKGTVNKSRVLFITLKDTVPVKSNAVFTAVEKSPEFPGGINAFFKFLAKNIKYPAKMREENIRGRVIISFVVEQDGSLTDFKVVRGVDPAADEEAVRALKLSPKWVPGVQNGKPVRVLYTVPITFDLADGDETKPNKTGAATNKSVFFSATNDAPTTIADTDKKKIIIHMGPPSSNNPLIVLDGKVMKSDNGVSPLSNINPDNIESISVLKDKSATALYGTKAADGVILITTKKFKLKLAN